MWQRRTLHECADELDQVSRRFRDACGNSGRGADQAEMIEASRKGVEILRVLALAIRSEQDFELIPNSRQIVGAIRKSGASQQDIDKIKEGGGWQCVVSDDAFCDLDLRSALNKIAHADPLKSDYFVGPGNHDLLLFGTHNRATWLAALSIPELINSVRSLPDTSVPSHSR
jgi:hypothetical protein